MTELLRFPLPKPDPLAVPPGYDALRRATPVSRVATDLGPAWLVTSAELAVAALADPRLGITPAGGEPDVRASLFCDGAAHARLRRPVAAAFRPARIALMRPRLDALAEEHIARIVEVGPPLDLIEALAAPLPVLVIAELIGVERARRPRFRQLADAMLTVDPVTAAVDPEVAAAAANAHRALSAFVGELVAFRRGHSGDDPPDDLLGELVAGGELDDDELIALVVVLLTAGTLTVRHALALAVLRLLGEAEFADLDPARVPAVVEEAVRRAGVDTFPRFAHEALDIGGVTIAAGERVLVSLEAANHDPDRFADPQCFRPGRTERHLGFGHGPHHCLGAALARAELAAVLPVLSRRLPGLRLDAPLAELPWHHAAVDISGPLALPVRW